MFFAAFSASSSHALGTCDPHTFGAKGDGIAKDTSALQAAIDACAQQGGGVVRLSAGIYLTAPVEMKTNITLQIDKGATLLGSPDHSDYPPHAEFRLPDLQPLVSAIDATKVAITGEGTIDGNGQSWWDEARSMKDHGILGRRSKSICRPRTWSSLSSRCSRS